MDARLLSTSLHRAPDAGTQSWVGRRVCGSELKLRCVQLLSTDSIFWFKSWERGILTEGAKTICNGVQERKQVSLYLVSLDRPANRTGVVVEGKSFSHYFTKRHLNFTACCIGSSR